jgi:hypothetical protein
MLGRQQKLPQPSVRKIDPSTPELRTMRGDACQRVFRLPNRTGKLPACHRLAIHSEMMSIGSLYYDRRNTLHSTLSLTYLALTYYDYEVYLYA